MHLTEQYCVHTDYTDDPDENLLPGEVNMAKLRNMYLSRRNLRVEKDESENVSR